MSQLEERKLCFVPKKLTSLSSLVYGMCCVRPFILCLRVCETKVGHFKSQQSFNTKPVTRQESHNSAKSHIFSMTFLFLYSIQYQHFSSSPFLSTISTPNYNIVKDREDCLYGHLVDNMMWWTEFIMLTILKQVIQKKVKYFEKTYCFCEMIKSFNIVPIKKT